MSSTVSLVNINSTKSLPVHKCCQHQQQACERTSTSTWQVTRAPNGSRSTVVARANLPAHQLQQSKAIGTWVCGAIITVANMRSKSQKEMDSIVDWLSSTSADMGLTQNTQKKVRHFCLSSGRRAPWKQSTLNWYISSSPFMPVFKDYE
jgi:hypothetical protein